MNKCALLVLSAGLVMAAGAVEKKTVVIWSEGTAPRNIYPADINTAIAEGLRESPKMKDWDVVVANLADPEQGLPDEILNKADVLMWWGHKKHGDVKDPLVDKIEKRVREQGMGFIALHSAHFAKPNKRLLKTPCSFTAYKSDITDTEVKVSDSKHPIAEGVKANFTVENAERYSDPYAVPPTDEVPFTGIHVHKDGTREEGKMGYCWTLDKGRFFYFQLGHETNPIYFDPEIRKIMANAVIWADGE